METTPLLARPRKRSWWSRLKDFNCRKHELSSRLIYLGELPDEKFPPNSVCNQKYSIITFLPLVLFQQFRFFLNLYFLVMSITQFIPSLRIGYLYTYWGPLGFVISVTLFREAIDDFRRYRRDKEVNTQLYERVALEERREHEFRTERVAAAALRVGDIVMLQKGERVPADMILLRTNESMGTVFIRTDQLDGEIDWKLRIPVSSTQKLTSDAHLLDICAKFFIEKPEKDIHSFIGTCTHVDEEDMSSLDIENTLWSGCVVASGQATGLIIYTGSEMRSTMNNAVPRSKVGRLDLQVNDLTKLLFGAVVLLSFLMISLKGFNGPWYSFMFRFVLLFSYIIPLSLRVNLELSKTFYSWNIQRDKSIKGTVMRSTTIPEELGRIQYVLADKTGTLTKNEMVFQKLHLGNGLFDNTNFHEVESLLTQHITNDGPSLPMSPAEQNVERALSPSPRQVWNVVLALALCHNVTPVYQQRDVTVECDENQSDMASSVVSDSCGGAVPQQQLCDYQASSPDEVALVKWTDMMGISLYTRDLHNISLKLRAANEYMHFAILQVFPFTSESKMMGIIVQEEDSGEISYYVKGADVALSRLLSSSWLAEECSRLAAEGLRTLVVAKKKLTKNEYLEFECEYKEARLNTQNRSGLTTTAINNLQRGLTLLGLTGVEDRLADNVPQTLVMLRTAGIKIWMLTGDKLETALCIARSLHLGGGGEWSTAQECSGRRQAHQLLETLHRRLQHTQQMDLIIEGESLEECLKAYERETVELLCGCAGVVVARCSPTQKARVVRLLRARGASVAAVGDGGNDVAMIQEADMGVGIEGAEGRAASLAGDVSIRQFSALARLLLVHGRRSFMRSAALCLFIIHRGLIVSTMQAVFSCVFYFSSVSLYPGFLMVGYGTVYTMLPVLSLILDKDIPSSTALNNPQLYKQLTKGRQLSYKTFFIWTAISIYQGGVIMYMALVLFEDELIHIVEISFTALILTELIMVALTVVTWHRLMVVAELVSLLFYAATFILFSGYFGGVIMYMALVLFEDELIHIVEISFTALILTELIMVALTVVTWHRLMVVAELVSLLFYAATFILFSGYFDAEFLSQWDFWWKVMVITVVSCLPLYVVRYTHRKWTIRQYKNIRK